MAVVVENIGKSNEVKQINDIDTACDIALFINVSANTIGRLNHYLRLHAISYFYCSHNFQPFNSKIKSTRLEQTNVGNVIQWMGLQMRFVRAHLTGIRSSIYDMDKSVLDTKFINTIRKISATVY